MAFTACAKVSGTYELLEQILLDVPARQLFVLQRTHDIWRTLIRRSEGLRKSMFLLADGPAIQPVEAPPNSNTTSARYERPVRINTMLHRALRKPDAVKLTTYEKRHHWCVRHHMLSPRARSTSDEINIGLTDLLRTYHSPIPHWFKVPTSARSMFMTQPPVQAVSYENKVAGLVQYVVARDFNICTIYNPTGVTLGDFVDCCENLYMQSQRYPDRWDTSNPQARLVFKSSAMLSLSKEFEMCFERCGTSGHREDDSVCTCLENVFRFQS